MIISISTIGATDNQVSTLSELIDLTNKSLRRCGKSCIKQGKGLPTCGKTCTTGEGNNRLPKAEGDLSLFPFLRMKIRSRCWRLRKVFALTQL